MGRNAAGSVWDGIQRLAEVMPIGIPESLALRFSARTQVFRATDELLPAFGWRAGAAIGAADVVLERLGAPWHRTAASRSDNDRWLEQLRGGLDAFARMCWCFRFGYTTAGVSVARRFIERWTYNLGSSTDTWPLEKEDTADYIRRVWSVYADLFSGRDLGEEWAQLSELLHGRSALIGSRSLSISFDLPMPDRVRIHNFAVRAAEVALRQVRGAIDTADRASGPSTDFTRASLQAPASAFHFGDVPDFMRVFSEPVHWDFVTSDDAETYSSWGASYRRMIASWTDETSSLLPPSYWLAIEERWARTIDEARRAFDAEQTATGEAFTPDALRGTLLQYKAIAELADLVAAELPVGPQRSALQTAASALESAWVLWLQDVDDSLLCIRLALESTARARTHRNKTETKAAQLEDRGAATTPHRWVEAAGWRGLSDFVRALGEFSHIQARSHHTGARSLLTAIQRSPSANGPEHTARANALDEVALMLGYEVATVLDSLSPTLATRFREIVLDVTNEEAEQNLQQWVQHGFAFRGFDFGSADLAPQVPDSAP